MISTSSYSNYNGKYNAYSIDGKSPIYKTYDNLLYPEMMKELYDAKQYGLNDEDSKKKLIETYYDKVLSKLDPSIILRELNDSFLLSMEGNEELSNRHIFAAWMELLLGTQIEELKVDGYTIEKLKRPEYIKEYLSDIMKKDLLNGFNSISASYYYKKGLMLEEKAKEIDDLNKKLDFKKEAISLEETALKIENEYNLGLKR